MTTGSPPDPGHGAADRHDPHDRDQWVELAPLIRRVARFDEATAVRLRRRGERISALAVLPSGALVGRTVLAVAAGPPLDWTVRAGELRFWLEGASNPVPAAAEAAWTRAIPPPDGWRRVDTVPAEVVRDLVRQGAEAHRDAADRDLGARAARTLLEAPVLTLTGGGTTAQLSNRELAALVSMDFLPDGGRIIAARHGRWTRAAAQFGSVFAEDRRGGLTLL